MRRNGTQPRAPDKEHSCPNGLPCSAGPLQGEVAVKPGVESPTCWPWKKYTEASKVTTRGHTYFYMNYKSEECAAEVR